jgi:hypothetical protein
MINSLYHYLWGYDADEPSDATKRQRNLLLIQIRNNKLKLKSIKSKKKYPVKYSKFKF